MAKSTLAIKKFVKCDYNYACGFLWEIQTPTEGTPSRGVTMGRARVSQFPGAESLRGSQITAGAPKRPNNVTSTFFITVNLLSKDLSFERGAPNLFPVPGAI